MFQDPAYGRVFSLEVFKDWVGHPYPRQPGQHAVLPLPYALALAGGRGAGKVGRSYVQGYRTVFRRGRAGHAGPFR